MRQRYKPITKSRARGNMCSKRHLLPNTMLVNPETYNEQPSLPNLFRLDLRLAKATEMTQTALALLMRL